MEKEFNLKKEREKLFKEELIGKILSAGRIYRKIRAQDKEFIKIIEEDVWANQENNAMIKIEKVKEILKKRSGDKLT